MIGVKKQYLIEITDTSVFTESALQRAHGAWSLEVSSDISTYSVIKIKAFFYLRTIGCH